MEVQALKHVSSKRWTAPCIPLHVPLFIKGFVVVAEMVGSDSWDRANTTEQLT